jgi:hypothetical protein
MYALSSGERFPLQPSTRLVMLTYFLYAPLANAPAAMLDGHF